MTSRALALVAMLFIALPAAGQETGVVRGGQLPAPLPLFPPSNW